MQEIIASMSGSQLDALSGHYRQRVLEERLGEDDSGTSSTELRRVSPMFESTFSDNCSDGKPASPQFGLLPDELGVPPLVPEMNFWDDCHRFY